VVQIKRVETARDLREFIKLPFTLYQSDRNWVPPLISEQKKFFSNKHNPFFLHSEAQLFLAREGNATIGRISAHTYTRHNLEYKDNIGFFGFFECADNPEAARALFAAAEEWNRSQGKNAMRGPFNFTINDEAGLLIDGFDTPPMLMMTHALPYYQKLYEQNGLAKAMDLFAFYSDRADVPERLERISDALMKRNNLDIHPLSRGKKQQRRDLEMIHQVYNEAWQYNWGSVPFTDEEFEHLADELVPLADPELVLIAQNGDRPVAFSLTMPNYNEVLKVMGGRVNPWTLLKALRAKRRITTSRVITMGVVREYQNRGIDTILNYLSFQAGIRKNLYHSEFSWVLESNVMMVRLAEMLGARIYKTYRIYEKPF